MSPTLQPQPHPTFAALAKESLWYAVPSALYMIDNNLLYYILNYVDAATHILVRRAGLGRLCLCSCVWAVWRGLPVCECLSTHARDLLHLCGRRSCGN